MYNYISFLHERLQKEGQGNPDFVFHLNHEGRFDGSCKAYGRVWKTTSGYHSKKDVKMALAKEILQVMDDPTSEPHLKSKASSVTSEEPSSIVILNELCQQLGIRLPQYETNRSPLDDKFYSVLTVFEKQFKSPVGQQNIGRAREGAATLALNHYNVRQENELETNSNSPEIKVESKPLDEHEKSKQAVFVKSDFIDYTRETLIRGADFMGAKDLNYLLDSFVSTGFQASNVALAIKIINEMRNWSYDPTKEEDPSELDFERANEKCKIFMGFTSNMLASGLRDSIRFLAQYKQVEVFVTTAGAVDADILKCLGESTFLSDSKASGKENYANGHATLGNLTRKISLTTLQSFLNPILDALLVEQTNENIVWTPSKIIARIGQVLDDSTSVLTWAYRNDIPIFCPALTDGIIGEILVHHQLISPGLVIDIVGDIGRINSIAVRAKCTGMIIVGGGLVKHHIANANLMRDGADYSVYLNLSQEFDGSDSGARPDEAVSWGKIKGDGKSVKVFGDATILLPLIMSGTFCQERELRYLKRLDALNTKDRLKNSPLIRNILVKSES